MSDSGGQDAANHPQTFRHWNIQTPDGQRFDVTRHPPATHTEMAEPWPLGSLLEPLEDEASQPPGPPLPRHQEDAIRAWLRHIGEENPAIISEVLGKARRDHAALAFYLDQAREVPEPGPKTCGDCAHYQRNSKPHLGHCGAGEPEPLAGLWDSQARTCGKWEVRP